MDEYATKLIETEQRSKSNTHRIDEMEKNNEVLLRLVTSVEVIGVEMRHMSGEFGGMKSEVGEVKAEIRELKGKPAARYNRIVEQAISIITGAVVGGIVGGLAALLSS